MISIKVGYNLESVVTLKLLSYINLDNADLKITMFIWDNLPFEYGAPIVDRGAATSLV